MCRKCIFTTNMKKTRILILFVLLILGKGALQHLMGSTSKGRSEDIPPPTLEEIHIDIIGGTTPPKPQSIVMPPVRIWDNATQILTVVSDVQTGWLTPCVGDGIITLLLLKVVNEDAYRATINLPSLHICICMLTVPGGYYTPFSFADCSEST